jgi:hypothetical protein
MINDSERLQEVTGVYGIGFDKDRNILLFRTNAEDYDHTVARPKKTEQVYLETPSFQGALIRELAQDVYALNSGLAEKDGTVVLGHNEDLELTQQNLQRELEEEQSVIKDHRDFVPFSKMGGNSGRHEQVVFQDREGTKLAIWSVGFWVYYSEKEISQIAQDQEITRVPIEKLAEFLEANHDNIRPATLLYLWDLLRHELEIV